MGFPFATKSDGSLTGLSLVLAFVVPVLSAALWGRSLALLLVVSSAVLTLISTKLIGGWGEESAAGFNPVTASNAEILTELRGASCGAEEGTEETKGGDVDEPNQRPQTERKTGDGDLISLHLRCLRVLATRCGSKQRVEGRRRKNKDDEGKEKSTEGKSDENKVAAPSDDEEDSLELMCQEAAFLTLERFPSEDRAVSASLALLALVAGDERVRRRTREWGRGGGRSSSDGGVDGGALRSFGIDVPIRAMRDALRRAKERDGDAAPGGEGAGDEDDDDGAERVAAELQRKGCLLLGAVADDDTDAATSVVDEGGLGAILDASDWYRLHEDVTSWALWSIFTLCYDHPGNKSQLIRLGGIQKVCRMMVDVPASMEVQRHGVAILFDVLRQVPGTPADLAQIRTVALNAGMHKSVRNAMTAFPQSTEIMLMGQQLLVATGYAGEIPQFKPAGGGAPALGAAR